QQKLTLLYSAMRHYAADLKKRKFNTLYHHLSDSSDQADYTTVLATWVKQHRIKEIHLLDPNEFDTLHSLPTLSKKLGIPVQRHPSPQFLVPREEFQSWAQGKKHLLMETHYRRLRTERNILLDSQGKPEGGDWNLDDQNRRTFREFAKEKPKVPPLPPPMKDPIVQEVAAQVSKLFPHHPGKAADLWIPTTREGALDWLKLFIRQRLEKFGSWEDTMVDGEPILFHSVLSPLLNLGLLTPLECIQAAEKAYRDGKAPLNSVEGFIRQILGWREFIHGIYWLKMPEYREVNFLGANRPLPRWAYTGETEMRCVSQAIHGAIDHAYNHHIQRLMVLGNFFLLGGYEPKAVLRWYSEMYLDAYDWVMVPNVLGMILFADGGFFATKPYAAGAAYQDKMGNHCASCQFDPKQREGPQACPFHSLYWNFFGQHAKLFGKNPRIGMMVKLWEKKTPADQTQIRQNAQRFLDQQA
ncbi:cryptochrome/photolyase family protein, partial [bacterium]|nr:cryptochrome/photolyase family protein [bacterium]